MTADRKLSVGLIGCGKIGWSLDDGRDLRHPRSHAGTVATLPDFELVAVCDADPEQARRAGVAFGAASFDDLTQMLAAGPLDIAVVATGPADRVDICRLLVSADVRAVLIEKPLAVSYADAQRLCAMFGQRPDIVVAVNYWRAWHPVWRDLSVGLQSGRWGAMRRIGVELTGGFANNGGHLLSWLQQLGVDFDIGHMQASSVEGARLIAMPAQLAGTTLLVQIIEYPGLPHALLDMEILLDNARVRIGDAGRRLQVQLAGCDPDFAGYRTLRPSVDRTDLEAPAFRHVFFQLAELLEGRAARASVTLDDACAALKLIEDIEGQFKKVVEQ